LADSIASLLAAEAGWIKETRATLPPISFIDSINLRLLQDSESPDSGFLAAKVLFRLFPEEFFINNSPIIHIFHFGSTCHSARRGYIGLAIDALRAGIAPNCNPIPAEVPG
jgi:hypothetical protein